MTNLINQSAQNEIISRDEAVALTDAIRSTTSALYILLKRAHDERAWASMGYNSWSEYIDNEFDFSRSRSYQLINQANVIQSISEAAGVELFITEKEARAIKKRLPEITERIEEETDDLEQAEAEARAKEILRNEANMLDNEESEVGHKYDMTDDYVDDVEVGGPGGMPDAPFDEDASKEKIIEASNQVDPRNFYADTLIQTLTIFEAMPTPQEMSELVRKQPEDKLVVMGKLAESYKWIVELMQELEM